MIYKVIDTRLCEKGHKLLEAVQGVYDSGTKEQRDVIVKHLQRKVLKLIDVELRIAELVILAEEANYAGLQFPCINAVGDTVRYYVIKDMSYIESCYLSEIKDLHEIMNDCYGRDAVDNLRYKGYRNRDVSDKLNREKWDAIKYEMLPLGQKTERRLKDQEDAIIQNDKFDKDLAIVVLLAKLSSEERELLGYE